MESKALTQDNFYKLIEIGPLVSVDLILLNKSGEVIVGYRNNNPAINTLFTPGGVIRKNEIVINAIKRILKDELGLFIENLESKLRLNGVFNHIYGNNFKDENFGTHYVCLSYIINIDDVKIEVPKEEENKYKNQHKDIFSISIENALNNKEVHQYVKEMLEYYINNNYE